MCNFKLLLIIIAMIHDNDCKGFKVVDVGWMYDRVGG